jgi:hypothetical protein
LGETWARKEESRNVSFGFHDLLFGSTTRG